MGPSNQQRSDSTKLYERLRKRSVLTSAWAHVYNKAHRSSSSETRSEAERFAHNATRNIERIAEELRQQTFRFKPSKPILIAKPGKKEKRPVVVAPVESRIVQRALLDLIQSLPEIKSQLAAGHNFGGVEGSSFGVPAAIDAVLAASKATTYYIRTDIKAFFTAVPRLQAVEKITGHIPDDRFNKCLVDATDTELLGVERLGKDVSLFPLYDEGVAQGSCLSPLLCNLLLADFDKLMNGRGIVCVRYIDDFILFARSKTAAFKALASGRNYLSTLGLDVYDPQSSDSSESKKADHGRLDEGFTFLGCDVKGEVVRPSRKNRARLKDKVAEIFSSTLGEVTDPKQAILNHATYADAVRTASLTVRGWGNTHSFCTDALLMKNLDIDLGAMFDDFGARVRRRISNFSKSDKRRALGLFLLEDCNKAR